MTVYVDNLHLPATVHGHETTWCHLTADSSAELVAFAVSIGLDANHIQHPGTWKEHFDVGAMLRAAAVDAGAVEVGALAHLRYLRSR